MPERPDECHVPLPERAAGLDVDGHLSLVAPFAPIDPGEVQHAVDGPIRHFRGEFVVGPVEGDERHGAEIDIGRRVAQIVRQPARQ